MRYCYLMMFFMSFFFTYKTPVNRPVFLYNHNTTIDGLSFGL